MVEGIGNKPILGGYSAGGIGEGAPANGAERTEKTHKNGLDTQLQTSEAKGKDTLAVGGSTPQLDAPNSTDSTQEIADSIVNTLGKLSSADSGKGLFILFQLLVLLQDAMNKMQESMQIMRQAETNVAIANIQAEADSMESAATFAMWLGIISSAVQIAGSAFSMAGGIKGVTSASKGMQTGNQMKTAQQELTALKTAENPDQVAIETKQMEYNGLKAKLDITTANGQARAARVQAIGQFIGSFGQFFKAIGDGISGAQQADAKRTEAQIKQMEESANKTADLTKAVKDMLVAVLQLMNSVSKNEIDTNAQIMRGI